DGPADGEAGECRVVGREGGCDDLPGFGEGGDGLGKTALEDEQVAEVFQAHRHFGVSRAEKPAAVGESAAQQGFGLSPAAAVAQHGAEQVAAARDVAVVRAENPLPYLQAAPGDRFGLVETA